VASESGPHRVATGFRIVLGTTTGLMLAVSWPLWTDGGGIPRVPFVRGLPVWPLARDGGLFVALIATIAASVFVARRGRARALDAAIVPVLAVLVLEDQARLQPWVYQFGLTSLALATLAEADALMLARLFIIGLYIHSGLSKLDVSFADELGLLFLETATHPLGLAPETWPRAWSRALVLAMPAWELAVGTGLSFRCTRVWALGGAVIQHLALLGILGPGLGHSTNVLIWNVALVLEDLILFGNSSPLRLPWPTNGAGRLTTLGFVLGLVMPLTERWGLWDTWPSFAVYSSHAERTDVFLDESELATLPPSLQRYATRSPEDPWARLDLSGWSRDRRGVPLYPQARTTNGLAEDLAFRDGRPRLVRVVHWGRADRVSGRRSRTELLGLEAIRAWGDRCWINAHPVGPKR
jgi:hypothetical protein